MPSPLEHLRTFDEPTKHEHRATQGRQGGRSGVRSECLERCESVRGAEQRVVYSYMFMGTRPWPQVRMIETNDREAELTGKYV